MSVVCFENLEARELFDALPLDVSSVLTPLGPELRIEGTDGNDSIAIARQGRGVFILSGTGWSMFFDGPANSIRIDGLDGNDRISVRANIWTPVAIFGGAGNDTLTGGTGDDRIYGGTGNDAISGAGGNDVIITLGGGRDRTTGGAGLDSFWLDARTRDAATDLSEEESAAGALHRISSYAPGSYTDPELTPAAVGYSNFSDSPLFSRLGPQLEDIAQGQVGDCFALAALGAIAKTDPQIIRQSMVDLGDGTYVVQFIRDDASIFVRVDADLPVNAQGNLAYAQLGYQQSIWVGIFEKAYAIYRLGTADYSSIDGGFPGEIFEDLGLPSQSIFNDSSNTPQLLAQVRDAWQAGQAVTIGTVPDIDDPAIVANHSYVLTSVQTGPADEIESLTLHSPWPVEATNTPDGNLVLSAGNATSIIWFAVIGSP
ncbi:MAG TPA: C2 family cysteine protease [Tepidisphaeraceae bacterium]|nr:C2 family cysteine protease [Tepidisphaeraceae bacterium]